MRSWLLLLTTLAGLSLFSGCQSSEKIDYTPTLARFFLEQTDKATVTATLPQSGVKVATGSKPVFTEGDVLNVELMQVELGKCLMFQLTPAAARDLYRVTGASQGRRLVLFLNNVPMGARRIDAPFTDGSVLVFVEVPEADLPALVTNLKKTTAAVQKGLKNK